MFMFPSGEPWKSLVNAVGPWVGPDRMLGIEWVTFLFREFPPSNTGEEIGYHDLGSLWFYSVLPGQFWNRTLN
jgi:hypothetical protein